MADIEIDRLKVYNRFLEPAAIRKIIEAHTLKELSVSNCFFGADSLAESLATEAGLKNVSFTDAALTDAGLKHLPLEQLLSIEIVRTRVTVQGLGELRRCHHLEAITLDGDHCTAAAAEILAELPQLRQLEVNGPGVTDEVAPFLRKCRGLRFLYLRGSKISEDAIETLGASLPACDIRIE